MSTDIAPEHLRCGLGECPSVHDHDGDLLIVGKRGDQIARDQNIGMSEDETAIVIPPEYFSDLPEMVRLRAENERLLRCQASAEQGEAAHRPAGSSNDCRGEAELNTDASLIAYAVAQRVAELSDRTSPDDWPEAMVVTAEELIFIVADEVASRIHRRPDEEPLAAMSGTSNEDASLTPQESPPQAEEASEATLPPQDASGRL